MKKKNLALFLIFSLFVSSIIFCKKSSSSSDSQSCCKKGLTGRQGKKGATGPQGDRGPKGALGAMGPIGNIGPKGSTGPIGPIGTTGITGSTGATGPIGPKGPTGSIGPDGPTGAKGTKGSPGAQGATSATGATGATGSTGPEGIITPVAFGYIYNTDYKEIPTDTGIKFGHNSQLVGISHTAGGTGSADITVTNGGIYAIFFSVTASARNTFGITITGQPIQTQTIYATRASINPNNPFKDEEGGKNTGFATVEFNAGDTFQLTNFGVDVPLSISTGGPNTTVNASVLIIQLE